MHIAMLLHTPVGRGTYWRALYLARGLAKLGHQIKVIATARERCFRFRVSADAQPGVTLVEAPNIMGGGFSFGWDPFTALARVAWVRKFHFDLIHGFESRPIVIVPALYLHHCAGVPLILDWCDWFGRGGSVEQRANGALRFVLRPLETLFEERFRTHADGTTVINTFLRKRAIALGIAPDTIFHFRNGSNLETLHPISQDAARHSLNLPQDARILGYVGAIFRQDAELMARAFNAIYREEPRARLLLIGYFDREIEPWIAAKHAVLRTGRLAYEDINRYLAACDVCWLPFCDSGANRGRFPLKINDYMAVGKPVVATRVGDVAALIERGAFGLLSSDQAEDLAAQVLLLFRNQALRADMGQRARHLAEDEFCWDDIALEMAGFYQHILGQVYDSG